MATVELFVFLFAPLVHRIKVSSKLASGLRCYGDEWRMGYKRYICICLCMSLCGLTESQSTESFIFMLN
jgi:hypothetical protein